MGPIAAPRPNTDEGLQVPGLWVRHAASSAAVVRTSVQACLERAGVTQDDGYDVTLVASELISNAVRHAPSLPSGHIAVRWSVSADGCLICVTDGGCATPLSALSPERTEVGGRGLAIVSTLAQDWGTQSHNDSTTVWAFCRFHQPARTAELASA